MPNSAAEMYKRITSRDIPKPWVERSEEEKLRAHQHFIASVQNATPEEDARMYEFIAIIQRNLEDSRSRAHLPEDLDAA